MEISVSDAKAQLTDLVRRAEAGEEVVLTRHGQAVATLNPVTRPKLSVEAKRALLLPFLGIAKDDKDLWPDAAHSQDFLYDENGMPQ
ncbi:MAG: type II toxin-antitoxin system prevent-host-death family antitoxin [Devosia sp.]